jgi:ATP-dependent exoDNAse (exonuclease V) beta subunit
LPLLRTLVPEPVVVDEESREVALDPPRRVWRVVPESAARAAPSWVVGKIVHAALEQWLFPESGGRDFFAWAAAEARGCGLTGEHALRDAVRRAGRMMTRFQATGLYERMAGAARCYREIPYSMIDDAGQLEHGVIDALFREQAGWVLVEFKTDHIEGHEALEAKLDTADYLPQVARYLAAAERALGVRPHPVLCLLNYAGAVRTVTDRW